MVLCWVPVVGFVFGVSALVTGVAANRRAKRGEIAKGGRSIAGIALGAAAIVVGGAISVWAFYVIISYQECIGHAVGRYEYSQCG